MKLDSDFRAKGEAVVIVKTPSESTAAAFGYLYQIRSALLWTLRQLRTGSEFLIDIETLDDVDFETISGDPSEILQTKHHKAGTVSLTDTSFDLWKTLRIRREGRKSEEVDSQSSLFLVTTACAPSESAAWYLRASSRNISAAQIALTAVAKKSTNRANAKGYHAFLAVDLSVREEILEKITIFDAAPNVKDLESDLKQEVYWAAGRENHAAFLQRLERWWCRRVLHQLSNATTDRIGSIELEEQMSDLREGFKQQSLPIDDDLLDFSLDDATMDARKGSTFIQRIELTKAGNRRIAAAIRDYYRAFEQRSRWLRDGLIVGGMGDLRKYEKRLVEEWELTFESVRDELGDAATADAKEDAARKVLEWAEKTLIPIRPDVTEPFVSLGSLQMISDELRVGGHIDFRDRLAHLLTTET
ncbi:MAG: hypothetical protein ISN28_12245 [Ectothiorhodospiraceae bacterium AqS1]|nr:hypothetical protein [Ectothiorhodospiraceae bacterium AqS1]